MSSVKNYPSTDEEKVDKSSAVVDFEKGTVADVDPGRTVEVANLNIVDSAIDTIGFGKFQWSLTFSAGFGFLVDQIILVAISLVTPAAAKEFGPKYATLLSAPLYAGLFTGAVASGTLADNFGRRLVWQVSLFGTSIVAMLAASSPNWAALNFWVAMIGLLFGGNLSIDLVVLSESLPRRYTFLLSGLACVWGLGNMVTGLIAWPLLINFSCASDATPATCPKSANMGWRYLHITLGGMCLVMAIVRAFALSTKESPRWLVSSGRLDEAVEVLNAISATNSSAHSMATEDFLQGSQPEARVHAFRDNLRRVRQLFAGARQLRLMVGLMFIWALIGVAYPLFQVFLPYYLAANGAKLGHDSENGVYRDWVVTSAVSISGPALSMWMVSMRWLRSRRSMFLTGAACAAFAGAFTTVRDNAQNTAFSSMIGFWLNALYSIVYGYTPAALSVENRGLGAGLMMATGRMASLSAPFIATFADLSTPAPIWVACACFAVIGLVALVLPVETTTLSEDDN